MPTVAAKQTLVVTKDELVELGECERKYGELKKKLSAAISEWSDGDSVALHIAYGIDYFCTNDQAKNSGTKSVFNPAIQAKLLDEFNFRKVTPAELLQVIE